jgi:hypothetical protein
MLQQSNRRFQSGQVNRGKRQDSSNHQKQYRRSIALVGLKAKYTGIFVIIVISPHILMNYAGQVRFSRSVTRFCHVFKPS